MKKAGYLRREGWKVLDGEGIPREILELHIHGATLGVCLDELLAALNQGTPARIMRIKQNWMPYLGGQAGSARISRSGKALNLDLTSGDRFTLALDAVWGVISRTERYAGIAELPPMGRVEPGRVRSLSGNHNTLSSFYERGAADELAA